MDVHQVCAILARELAPLVGDRLAQGAPEQVRVFDADVSPARVAMSTPLADAFDV